MGCKTIASIAIWGRRCSSPDALAASSWLRFQFHARLIDGTGKVITSPLVVVENDRIKAGRWTDDACARRCGIRGSPVAIAHCGAYRRTYARGMTHLFDPDHRR